MRNKVIAIVCKIPFGKVTTYGTIAAMCGSPKSSRLVGQILRASKEELPWHRVVGHDGYITIINTQHPQLEQVERLRAEGIELLVKNNIYQINDFNKYFWKDY